MKMLSKTLLMGALLSLNGCAVVYSCKGHEGQKEGCESLSAVAKKTKGDLPPEPPLVVKSRAKGLKKSAERTNLGGVVLSQPKTGVPILTPPKTMRILFAPFKDEQGDLNIGGFVYLTVADGEWVLAK